MASSIDRSKKIDHLKENIHQRHKKNPTPAEEPSPVNAAAFKTALRLLNQRDHSEAELRRKLEARHYQPEVITPTIVRCQELGYVDDRRCAEHYFRERARKGYGHHHIRRAMAAKGLEAALIEQTLADHWNGADEIKRARRLVRKKLRSGAASSPSAGQIRKVRRFLFQRGFDNEIIAAVLPLKEKP
jgi:regulatory protein